MNLKNIELNALQSISVTGVITSLLAQGFLLLLDKTVSTFWALYPSWVVIFLLGSLVRAYRSHDVE